VCSLKKTVEQVDQINSVSFHIKEGTYFQYQCAMERVTMEKLSTVYHVETRFKKSTNSSMDTLHCLLFF